MGTLNETDRSRVAAVCDEGTAVAIIVSADAPAADVDVVADAGAGFGASLCRIQNVAAIAVARTATPRTMRVADCFKRRTAFLFLGRLSSSQSS